MSSYAIVSSVALLFLGQIWAKSSPLNVVCKLCCFAIGVWGLVARFGP